MTDTHNKFLKFVSYCLEHAPLLYNHADFATRQLELSNEIYALQHHIEELEARCHSEEFLSNGRQEIFDLLEAVRAKFDGTEYQQGKKDGLRSALALLGTPEMISLNRGGNQASPTNHNPQLDVSHKAEGGEK